MTYQRIISLHINEKFTNEKVEELEDTKKEIRIRKSKDRKHNGQKKKRQKDKQRFQKLLLLPVFL
jgi:hypothetical protein